MRSSVILLIAVAAPLAGNSGASLGRFLLYDSAGAILWSGAYLMLGYVFSEQLETVVDYASRLGSGLLFLVAGLFALWIVWKYIQRRRFVRELDIARITPEELRDRIEAGEDLFIVDLRTGMDTGSGAIRGAVRMSTEDLRARRDEIPRDREIILFCT